MNRFVVVIVLLIILGGGWFLLAGHSADKAKNGPPAVNVVTANVEQKDLPLDLNVIGNVVANQTVAIKSRVDSAIMEIHFKDGDEVKKGDILFVLDRRTLEAQLQSLKSNLARDRALLEDARMKYNRAKDLKQKGYETVANYDTAKANYESQQASVAVDQAAIDSANVQLGYTVITAPIDGRAGTINLTVGNNVKANDTTPLVVLNEIKPIRAQLAVPQIYLAALRKSMAETMPEVIARIDHDENPVVGKLTYIDNQVDAASGTFVARATFDNMDERLWPGMFVNLTVRLGVEKGALIMPETAVQHGQSGDYFFVIANGKATKQPVKVERVFEGMAVITANVNAGDAVVVDGALTLKDGDAVSVRYPDVPKEAPKPADKPAEKPAELIPLAPTPEVPSVTDKSATDKPAHAQH
ncbi:MAG: efflux RND transporter periplasmic adaptor subunit [Alphaproteobacteria bacterium]|nr:efflux RND transporter periplasmic adaptor subunit [Alphaproteobacteria bacterium]